MTIYVDELQAWGKSATWKYSHSCHMTCDGGFEELHQLAERIGLKREWFQIKTRSSCPARRDRTLK